MLERYITEATALQRYRSGPLGGFTDVLAVRKGTAALCTVIYAFALPDRQHFHMSAALLRMIFWSG
jgi:hypothetical protein